jgi:nucleotide-binding universal stress UspA family protein
MFKHLVVPLDGSRLAEAAVPAAAFLAGKLGASVTLLHIIERDAPQEVHGERHLTEPQEARAYLDEIAQRDFPAAIHVERHVHTAEMADVARGIVEHVHELAPDMIVMCTHGRGGLGDWFSGTIAQQVVARAKTPVLLIRPAEGGADQPFECARLLVPLDGNPEHEEGLPVAAALARACGAPLFLLLVVPTLGTLSNHEAATGLMLPGATRAVLELAEQDAAVYLARHAAALKAQGLEVEAEVRRGNPMPVILDAAQEANAAMIVLGTHGKAGWDAFWSGSVSPRLSSRWRQPLLLVPVTRPAD